MSRAPIACALKKLEWNGNAGLLRIGDDIELPMTLKSVLEVQSLWLPRRGDAGGFFYPPERRGLTGLDEGSFPKSRYSRNPKS